MVDKSLSTRDSWYASIDKTSETDDARIQNITVLPPPEHLIRFFPIQGTSVEKLISKTRKKIRDIMHGKDDRLLVIIGPCSIHDPSAAIAYAHKLLEQRKKYEGELEIVMRVYFEKPRTTVGWKGLINDPEMNDSFKIEKGLHTARRLLLKLSAMGLPTSTEALDPISPQYLHDIITWSAIGARTTESQTHREMSSGLSSPVGFKNGTDGGLEVAINALKSVASPHRFLGIDPQGLVSIITTTGNPHAHIVLRGGNGEPNFDAKSVAACEAACRKAGVTTNIMIDCSHANSSKKPENQPAVFANLVDQIVAGNKSIIGVMLESNIHFGRQDIPTDLSQLKYGVSVTDGCIDWETTERTLREAHARLKAVLPAR